jgi:hypothetical protein
MLFPKANGPSALRALSLSYRARRALRPFATGGSISRGATGGGISQVHAARPTTLSPHLQKRPPIRQPSNPRITYPEKTLAIDERLFRRQNRQLKFHQRTPKHPVSQPFYQRYSDSLTFWYGSCGFGSGQESCIDYRCIVRTSPLLAYLCGP